MEVLQAEDLFETEVLHVLCSGFAGLVLKGAIGPVFDVEGSYRNSRERKRGAALVETEGECTGGWVWQLCQSHGNKT